MAPKPGFWGNFRGWVQWRKTIKGEHDMLAPKEEPTTGPMTV